MSVIQECLKSWAADSTWNPEQQFLYMCFFVNNQYRILTDDVASENHDLENIFRSRLQGIGKMVALLDTWHNPTYLRRVWTIFEQYVAACANIEVVMALPNEAEKSMIQKLENGKDGILEVKASLANINSCEAEAWSKTDEEQVKAIVRRDIGFDALNTTVARSLTSWIGNIVKHHFQSLVDEEIRSKSFKTAAYDAD